MPTYYIDPVNGDDARTGASWGTSATGAWKTITSGATQARIAPGDTIKIAKSPNPVDTGIQATWEKDSVNVVLASSLTKNIDLCESNWSAAANVTPSSDTNYNTQGTYCQKLIIGSTFATGTVAYHSMATASFASYDGISMMIKTASDIAANIFRLDLCSNSDGTGIIDSFPITIALNYDAALINHTRLTIMKSGGGKLGSAIKSVKLHALSDPGSVTLYLDNIMAVTSGGLSLNCVIGKNDGFWWPIKSISGTTLEIGPGCIPSAFCKYTEASGDAELYFRTGHYVSVAAAPTTAINTINDSGSAGSLITFEGGYNTSTGNKDGETWFDLVNQLGYGIYASLKTNIRIDNIHTMYGHTALQWAYAATNCQFKDISAVGCFSGLNLPADDSGSTSVEGLLIEGTIKVVGCNIVRGIYFPTTLSLPTITADFYILGCTHNATSRSFCIQGKDIWMTGTIYYKRNTSDYGIRINGMNIRIKKMVFQEHCMSRLLYMGTPEGSYYSAQDAYIEEIQVYGSDNSFGCDMYLVGGKIRIGKITFLETFPNSAVAYVSYPSSPAAKISFDYWNAANRWLTIAPYGQISDQITGGQDAAWSYGGSGTCLYLNPSSTTMPLILDPIYLPVVAGTTYNLKMYVKKTSAAANCTLQAFRIEGCGIVVISAESIALTDSWAEYVSTSFTPTFDGYVRVDLWAYEGSPTGNIGIDNIRLVAAA